MSGALGGPGGHVVANRAAWDHNADGYAAAGRRGWADDRPAWGIFRIPDDELPLLPDVTGLDVLEVGCGTAYVSAWLARRGARSVVGLDNSPRQLATAARLMGELGPRFPLVHGDAERCPFPDGVFDLVVSEYGASLWCDPEGWVPEAARLLRRGGELLFLTNSALAMLCVPDTDAEGPAGPELRRSYFDDLGRTEWPDEPGVEFHLGHGDWIRLLRRCGFDVEDLVEVRPPPSATTAYPWMTTAWARRWPCEEVWRARRR